MTTFHLVRHGTTDVPPGVLAGRKPEFHLAHDGASPVAKLIPRLARGSVSRIYCSPLERTRETAQILAEGLGRSVQVAKELLEVDFGAWTGASFQELEATAEWLPFNTFRSGTRIPGGEFILETQIRIVSLMLRLRDEAPDEEIVLVSHADVIRPALTYFLGVPLDFLLRLRIDPASISTVQIHNDGAEVLAVNWTA